MNYISRLCVCSQLPEEASGYWLRLMNTMDDEGDYIKFWEATGIHPISSCWVDLILPWTSAACIWRHFHVLVACLHNHMFLLQHPSYHLLGILHQSSQPLAFSPVFDLQISQSAYFVQFWCVRIHCNASTMFMNMAWLGVLIRYAELIDHHGYEVVSIIENANECEVQLILTNTHERESSSEWVFHLLKCERGRAPPCWLTNSLLKHDKTSPWTPQIIVSV